MARVFLWVFGGLVLLVGLGSVVLFEADLPASEVDARYAVCPFLGETLSRHNPNEIDVQHYDTQGEPSSAKQHCGQRDVN